MDQHPQWGSDARPKGYVLTLAWHDLCQEDRRRWWPGVHIMYIDCSEGSVQMEQGAHQGNKATSSAKAQWLQMKLIGCGHAWKPPDHSLPC